jgi:hypothetical protein
LKETQSLKRKCQRLSWVEWGEKLHFNVERLKWPHYFQDHISLVFKALALKEVTQRDNQPVQWFMLGPKAAQHAERRKSKINKIYFKYVGEVPNQVSS